MACGLCSSSPLLALGGPTGCGTIGPDTVTRDRFNYTEAVADSWKGQMLLNLVKFRYGDATVFLDVGQIVAGYSFQRGVLRRRERLRVQQWSRA
jgi:hypothetical protein